ncbi:glycosyl hydrolase family 28-related protein [Catenovulum agarivorans]|uniref:glycosyl hydrolase family 28-related protein n=1 Tax=Catenovulum agarivorans TaxID=1172192 RepID=UPI0002F010EC|nr:glycosyl hydrolase family 28-related protein [Catenovulum agarivorans]
MQQIQLETPFNMPAIQIADFSQAKVFDIRDYGAQPNNQQANEQAIAAAIQAANANQGGRVYIPAGEWICAKIHLKSFVDLHLAEGATLLFSAEPAGFY